MTLTDQLDEIVSDQPYADRPAAHYLAEGRRVRTRRRLAACGVGAAALALVGTGALAFGPSSEQAGPTVPEIASQSPRPAGPRSAIEQAQQDMAQSGQAATYATTTGDLVLAPGWTVTQRIGSPWRTGPFGGATPPDRSVALVLVKGKQVQWALLDWEKTDGGEAGAIYDDDPGARGFGSLSAYVDLEMALHNGRSTDQAVAFAPDGSLEPRNGITVVEQASVTLPDGTDASLAHLQVLDNQLWLVARHRTDGPDYQFIVFPREHEENTLPAFLARVSQLVSEGRLP